MDSTMGMTRFNGSSGGHCGSNASPTPGTQRSQATPSQSTSQPEINASEQSSASATTTKSVSLDISKTQSTNEFDYKKQDKIHTYTVKPGHSFNKIVKGNTTVWEQKNNICGTKVIFIDETEKYLSVLLTNNTFSLCHLENNTWKDVTSTKHDVTRLKFYDDKDKELNTSQYNVTLVDYSYRFIFNSGVNCKRIKLGDDDVWKHSDDVKFKEITSFDLGLISNAFFVKNKNEFKKLEFKPTPAKPATVTTTDSTQSTTTPQPKAAATTTEVTTTVTTQPSSTETKAPTATTPQVSEAAVTPSTVTPVTAEAPVAEAIIPTVAPKTEVVKSSDPVPAKVKVTVETPMGNPRPKRTPEVSAGPKKAVPVNINGKESTNTSDFREDYLKNVKVYTPKDKFIFNQVVFIKTGSNCCGSNCCASETVIWEAKNQSEHFDKVLVDGLGTFSKTKNFSVHLCNGTHKHFNKSTFGGWSEAPNLVDLDLRTTNSNITVDFSKKDNCRTFTAKPGYTIRRIRKNKKCGSGCCGERVIWESIKDNAVKVVLVGIKKEEKHLSILLETGEPVFLYKEGKGKPWQNVTASKNKLTDLRMYALAEGNKQMELHRGHYSVTLFGTFYGCLFYDDVCCVEVSHKDKTLWNKKEEKEFGNLKGVFLDVTLNKFSVMNDDDNYWLCEEVKKAKPVTLNINGKASTEDYDYTVDHNRNVRIYTAKGNSIFNQVRTDNIVWETKDPTKYASKVFTDGIGACSLPDNVSIYLTSGEILHFHWSGGWKPAPSKITLNLSKTSSAIFYDFHHDGEKRTFTAKPGFLFNSVILKSSWTWLVCGSSCCKSGCLSDKVFWEAQKEDECSTKVVVYGVESSIKNINIFQNNNQVKHFHKVGGDWITTTPFVLDIDKNSNNDLFDYRSTRGFGHFNPKANLTIEKIVKNYKSNCCVSTCCGSVCCGSECCGTIDEHVIWTAQKDDHGLKAVLMGAKKEEKHLSVLLQSGGFVLLQKTGKGQPWVDITQNKHNFSGVKLYSLDERTSNYHELTREDYEPIVFECRFGYELKEGVRCVRITNNDMLLWSHTDDPEFGYPRGLYLDLRKNQFIITSLKDQTRELTKPEIKLVTLDIDKTDSTGDFEHYKKRKFHRYTIKSGRFFNKVVQGTTDIWNSKNLLGTIVGTRTKDNGKHVIIVLENDDFKLFHQPEGGKWTDITNQKGDVTKLKFYSPTDDELTPSNYTVTILGHCKCFTFSYKFDCGMKCKTVMYGEDTIWDENKCCSYKTIQRLDFDPVANIFYAVKNSCEYKKIDYEPKPTPDKVEPVKVTPVKATPVVTAPAKPTEPTKVTLDIEKKQATDQFNYYAEKEYHKYLVRAGNVFEKILQGTNPIFQSKDGVFGTRVGIKVINNVRYLSILCTNNALKLFTQTAGKWTDNTKDRYEIGALSFYGEGDAVLKPLTHYGVDIVDYSYELTFKSGVNCRKIMYGDDNLWRSTDDPKFKDITIMGLGLVSNNFFVYKTGSEFKKLEYKGPIKPKMTQPRVSPILPPPKPAEPAKVALDIEKKQTTSEYDFKDENGVVTYTPKSDFLFSKVSEGQHEIWKSAANVYGKLVRTKETKGIKYLVVLLTNRTFSLFQEGENEWTDITSKRHDVKKLKFYGDGDTPLKATDYDVTIVDMSFSHSFKSGVSCKKVKLGQEVVWSHTDDPKFQQITVFSLGLASNCFFIKNPSGEVKIEHKQVEEVTRLSYQFSTLEPCLRYSYGSKVQVT